MKKGIIGAIIALVVIAGLTGAFVLGKDKNKPEPAAQPTTTETNITEDTTNNETENTQPSENAETTDEVEVENMAFTPANITVTKGTKVTWTNKDNVIHTVTSKPGAPEAFDSGNLTEGGTFSFTFNKVGTYNYFCQPHPQMTGTVTVTE